MFQQLIRLPRLGKKFLLLAMDFLFLCFALWFSFFIRLEQVWPAELVDAWPLILVAPIATLPVFVYLGLYQAVVRYIAPRFAVTILKAILIAVFLLVLTVAFGHLPGFPRSVYFLYFVYAGILIGGSRLVARELLGLRLVGDNDRKLVAIYGAGSAGTQICKALQASQQYLPVAFLDDDRELQGLEILGCRVFPPAQLNQLIQRYHLDEVVLAMPSEPSWRKRELVMLLQAQPVVVKVLPGLAELINRAPSLGDLRQLEIEDLLGREPVAPDTQLMRACISGKSVLVTGAGGSIGSELCFQIADLAPSHLLLYEQSEAALYRIARTLTERYPGLRFTAILGSALDEKRLVQIITQYRVRTIYHAAAYKHVPLVETNLIEGLRNNVLGAWFTVRAAIAAGVDTLIFISSDKAVRPTNIMGASKRLSEMIMQALAQESPATQIKIVRFGNVLGSSGSVVPLFREQIRQGGPVTVTDPEVSRYFMIPREAAQLTIQAGAMGHGGDVYVLDMGEPIRIQDLAVKMIHLSGLKVRDPGSDAGDIAIAYIGLRPGEKLHEELVTGGGVTSTEHPRILRSIEQGPRWPEVEHWLTRLRAALDEGNLDEIHQLLRDTGMGYLPNEKQGDPVLLDRTGQPSLTEILKA